MDFSGERREKNHKHCRANPVKQQDEPFAVVAKDSEMKVKKAKKKHEHLHQIGLGTLPLTLEVSVADIVLVC